MKIATAFLDASQCSFLITIPQEYIIMYDVLAQLLSIHNYKVVGVEITDDTITLDIESTWTLNLP